MSMKMMNESHIEGYVYDHTLELKVSGERSKNPGTEFIAGNLNIATDEACLNVIPVHFTYVTATTKSGGANQTFNALKRVLDGGATVAEKGKDAALKVRVDTAVDLNEWFSDMKDEEPISNRRNEGGFVHIVNELNMDEKQRSTFRTDMVITGTRMVDADEERNLPEKLVMKGYIFNFRKEVLPIEYSAVNPAAISYFEGLGATGKTPVFTRVWGQQVSQTVTRNITEESAFGEASVRTVTSSNKDFVVTGASRDTYAWDDEGTITAAELAQGLADRQVKLAEMKQRQIEYQASRNNTAAPAVAVASTGGYNF